MKSNRLLVIITIFIIVSQLISSFGYLELLISIELSEFKRNGVIRSLLPIFILTIGSFLFWKRRTIGWILLVIGHLYLLMIYIAILITDLSQESMNELVQIYAPIQLTDYLTFIVTQITILFLLLNKKIRLDYNVKTSTAILSFLIAVIVSSYTEYYVFDGF